jgi:hypothetical protein
MIFLRMLAVNDGLHTPAHERVAQARNHMSIVARLPGRALSMRRLRCDSSAAGFPLKREANSSTERLRSFPSRKAIIFASGKNACVEIPDFRIWERADNSGEEQDQNFHDNLQ